MVTAEAESASATKEVVSFMLVEDSCCSGDEDEEAGMLTERIMSEVDKRLFYIPLQSRQPTASHKEYDSFTASLRYSVTSSQRCIAVEPT